MDDVNAKFHQLAASGEPLYFRCEPDILDFTQEYEGKLLVSNSNETLEFSFGDDRRDRNILSAYTMIVNSILGDGTFTITWDIKRLFSYLFFRTHRRNLPLGSIFDLKYAERFMGQDADRRRQRPPNYEEAVRRFKFIQSPSVYRINRELYLPLAIKVLPILETRGLHFERDEAFHAETLYVSYDIEAQVNGRLSSTKPNDNFLVAHNLSPEIKRRLVPRQEVSKQIDVSKLPSSKRFVLLDFKHMEVSLIQWLTKDETLTEMLGKDVYSEIYTALTDGICDSPKKRDFAKKVFLSVIFGLGVGNLSKDLKLPPKTAEIVMGRLKAKFSTAMAWLQAKQDDLAADSIAIDSFGRRREILPDKAYLRRNFEVQAPSAVICLLKLVELFDAPLSPDSNDPKRKRSLADHLLLNIHDAYVLEATSDQMKEVVSKAKEVLESPIKWCPGLQLKVSISVGERLTDMKKIL